MKLSKCLDDRRNYRYNEKKYLAQQARNSKLED